MINKLKKLIFLINDLNFFYTHRFPIAQSAKKKNFDVLIAYGELGGVNIDVFNKNGLRTIMIPMKRGSINIFSDMISCYHIWHLFRKEKPDIVHLVTIKPYLYGGIIARFTRVPNVVSAISGFGALFIHNDIKSKILRFLLYPIYLLAFNHSNQIIIVQNHDDANYLIEQKITVSKKIKLIRGSGVDLENFKYFKEKKGTPTICFTARLLADKGIFEFISAAKLLIKRGVDANFLIAGDLDPKNPRGLNQNDIEKIKMNRFIKFLGHCDDIPLLYSRSNIICLPSYREGLPKSLIEAAAASRAIVTTDVPGCRDAIIPNKTGLLVPIKNDSALADALQDLVLNSKKREDMGKAGRKLAEKYFSIDIIVNDHIDIYKELLRNLNN